MALHVSSGPAQVLHQGMTTSFGGHPVTFTLEHGDVETTVRMEFGSDSEIEGVKVETAETSTGYVFRCTNFDSDVGRGSSQPVLVNEVGGELIFFHFRVFLFGRTLDRTIHFTFFAVDKEAVGWTPH